MNTLFLPLLLAAAPADAAEISVIGSLFREATVSPGQPAEGVVLVRNHADEPVEVLVHQRDYVFRADGSNAYDAPGSRPRSNSDWVRFSPGVLVLGPGETAPVHYRVTPPADAEQDPGTYWSLLMIEPAPDPLPPEPDGRGVVVRTVIRYAVQLVTHVGHDAPAGLSFTGNDLRAVDGGVRMSVDVENVGDRLLKPRVWIDVYDEAGGSVGRFTAPGHPNLLPGCSTRFPFDLTGLPPGRYAALAVADAGDDQVYGAPYTLDLRP